MANKNLTDLTARTATADSDLLHINSGGTDYKETKIDFLKGSFGIEFSSDSPLTSQIDALPGVKGNHYEGIIIGNGHQTETGLPEAKVFTVYADVYASSFKIIEIVKIEDANVRYVCTKSSSWSAWSQLPARSEITALNNSLTKSSVSVTPVSGVTVNANSSILVDGIVILNIRITTSSIISAGSSLLSVPAPKTSLTGGSGAIAVATNNASAFAIVSAQGQLAAAAALPAGTYILSCVYEKA